MALTKTVTYTQAQPESLGFSNEIVGTTGEVTVNMQYLPAMGKPSTGVYGATFSCVTGLASYTNKKSIWSIKGTLADVNAALNDLKWEPRVYSDGLIKQDPRNEPTYVEFDGEFVLKIKDDGALIDTVLDNKFNVAIDGSTDPLGFVTFYANKITSVGSMYEVAGFFEGRHLHDGDKIKDIAKNVTTVNISGTSLYVYDFQIRNPIGQHDVEIAVLDDGSLFDSGTLTLTGGLSVAPPSIVPETPGVDLVTIATPYIDSMNLPLLLEDTTQTVGVQLVAKRYPTDPLFDGDTVTNVPSYITDNSYVMFDNVCVGRKTSKTYPDGLVRWEFYGTPAECNQALNQLTAITFGYDTVPRDFLIETRVISSRDKTNNSKGVL